ncbi:unnamed protein product [Prunus armeniaca]
MLKKIMAYPLYFRQFPWQVSVTQGQPEPQTSRIQGIVVSLIRKLAGLGDTLQSEPQPGTTGFRRPRNSWGIIKIANCLKATGGYPRGGFENHNPSFI